MRWLIFFFFTSINSEVYLKSIRNTFSAFTLHLSRHTVPVHFKWRSVIIIWRKRKLNFQRVKKYNNPFGHSFICFSTDSSLFASRHLIPPFSLFSRAWAVGSLTLLFLQSVTWSSGLMFLSAPSLLLAYLFSSLNTAQALLITILHCTLARKVRGVVSGKVQMWREGALARYFLMKLRPHHVTPHPSGCNVTILVVWGRSYVQCPLTLCLYIMSSGRTFYDCEP